MTRFDHLTHPEAIELLRQVWPEVEAFRTQSDEAFKERQRHAREGLKLTRRIEELERELKTTGRLRGAS